MKKITLEKLAQITEQGFINVKKEITEGFVNAAKQTDDKIEKLAIMVQKGFEETAKKADLEAFKNETNERFDKADERLGKIEQKLDNVVYQAEFYQLKIRVDHLEKRVSNLKK